MKKKFSRRDFLKLTKYFFLSAFVVGSGGMAYGVFVEPDALEVTEVEIKLSHLSRHFYGYRIV